MPCPSPHRGFASSARGSGKRRAPNAQDSRSRCRQCLEGLPEEDAAWLRREIGGTFRTKPSFSPPRAGPPSRPRVQAPKRQRWHVQPL
eukprot:2068180-Pyramimonas_sp.AAC.1